MLGMIKAFMPSKLVIAAFVALALFCGYLYMQNQLSNSRNETLQTELDNANERLSIQEATITQMMRDIEIQRNLLDYYMGEISRIRVEADAELREIEETQYGRDANANALEFQHVINERFKRMLDNITRTSREGTQ